MKSDILRTATLTGSQAMKKASLRLFDWSEPRFGRLLEGSFTFYGLFTKGRLHGGGRWSNSTRGV